MEHEKQHIQGPIVKKNHQYYRRTGAIWTDPFHTPTDRLHLTNYRPDLDEAHKLHVKRQKEKQQQGLAEKNLRLLGNQDRIRTSFQHQYNKNRQKYVSLTSSIRISGQVYGRRRKAKTRKKVIHDHSIQAAQLVFEIDHFEQRVLQPHIASGTGNPWRPGYDYTM